MLVKVGPNDPTCVLLVEECFSLAPKDDTEQTPPDPLLDTPLDPLLDTPLENEEEKKKSSEESLSANHDDETSDCDLYGGVAQTWEDFILPDIPNTPNETPNSNSTQSPTPNTTTPTKDVKDVPDTSTEQAYPASSTTSPGRPYSLAESPYQPPKKANVLLQYQQGLVQAPPSPQKQKFPKCNNLILFPDNMYSYLDFQDPKFIKIQSIWGDDDGQATWEDFHYDH